MKDTKTFCIIAMDNIRGLDDDLNALSLEPINMLKGAQGTALVATFVSDLEISRIKEVLDIGERSFFISEMNSKTFSAHVDNEEIQNTMFGELETQINVGNNTYNEKGDLKTIYNGIKKKYDEEQLSSLDSTERKLLIDELLNNGNDLTNNQKKALNFLAAL